MRLINQRGRVVEVKYNNVKKLLATGKWIRAPEGEKSYNPVFDTEKSPFVPSSPLTDSPHVYRAYLEVLKI